MTSDKTAAVLNCGGRFLSLERPIVMGVLNITPDSFSDGGRWYRNGRADLSSLIAHAASMVSAGAEILDVGGESTRPGADPVSQQEELDRVVPVVEALAAECEAVISVDSSSPVVMREAAEAGAGLLNDVRALQREGAVSMAADLDLPVCLMHMQGSPETMQQSPDYTDVVDEVGRFLLGRVAACEDAGISRDQILLDPGFGFGKTLEHNLELFAGLPRLRELGFPLLVGLSRKSLIAKITGREVDERLPGSLAFGLMAVERGARLVRVHDVAETADVLKILAAVQDRESP
ncbi:MAG: dihydropteroate synthase [Pseudomonadota bacterium]